MDGQSPHPVAARPDEQAPRVPKVVSIGGALRRWAVGTAVGALLMLALSWFYSDDGWLVLLNTMAFLHDSGDRRSRWALGAAALVTLPVAVVAATVGDGRLAEPWGNVLYAAIGALGGSLAYAGVTQLPDA